MDNDVAIPHGVNDSDKVETILVEVSQEQTDVETSKIEAKSTLYELEKEKEQELEHTNNVDKV